MPAHNFTGGRSTAIRVASLSTALILFAPGSRSQGGNPAAVITTPSDPGVRGGAAGAGQVIAGLTTGEIDFFTRVAQSTFNETENIAGGLGPRFNLDSCAQCHSAPAVGGSSPASNPQIARAAMMAPGNQVPAFLSSNGPVRAARFVKNADGTADGQVHDVFTIVGRADAPVACAITQPDFSNTSNIVFRIPTPTFGAGLIESISDLTIVNNLANDANGQKVRNGITGHVNVGAIGGTLNTDPTTGGVSRFGWKAQDKSLAMFAGEAYNVEMGITNELFPNELEDDPNCATNATPESDFTFSAGSFKASEVTAFRGFMRFLAPPVPSCSGNTCSPAVQNGHTLASTIGCFACHTETLMTGLSSTAALSNQAVNLFSDLAVHHMGTGLADGITQGTAGPDEFRSAPLWGIGQRIFFLHDGRTTDLLAAIKAHQSSGSEANTVIGNFLHLTATQQQEILNFLRTL